MRRVSVAAFAVLSLLAGYVIWRTEAAIANLRTEHEFLFAAQVELAKKVKRVDALLEQWDFLSADVATIRRRVDQLESRR